MPVLTYGSETMIWREKERSRIKDAQMNNRRGLLGIRRMDKVPNARIMKIMWTKGLMNRFSGDSGMLRECKITGLQRGLL